MQMTNHLHETAHRTFGGVIYLSDFNTGSRGRNNTKGSPIANRIAGDHQFDRQCRINREIMERNKSYGSGISSGGDYNKSNTIHTD